MQYGAVWCSVVQCSAAGLHGEARISPNLHDVPSAVSSRVLQDIAVRCSVSKSMLQCGAVCCSVVQRGAA